MTADREAFRDEQDAVLMLIIDTYGPLVVAPHALVTDLVAIRKARGLKQSTVAQRMRIRQSVTSELERGYYPPSIAILDRYAEAVGARITVEDNAK